MVVANSLQTVTVGDRCDGVGDDCVAGVGDVVGDDCAAGDGAGGGDGDASCTRDLAFVAK